MGRKRFGWMIFSIAAVVMLWIGIRHPPSAHSLPPATQRIATSSFAATSSTKTATPLIDYMAIVREAAGPLPVTQPLDTPLSLSECARFILPEPIKLDADGELWITHAEAPPLHEVMKSASTQPLHLVRESVLFVHREPPGEPGLPWSLQLVCSDGHGGISLIDRDKRTALTTLKSAQWDHAIEWNSARVHAFAVPTDDGVTVVQPNGLPLESHISFDLQEKVQPVLLLDSTGLLAWVSFQSPEHPGSHGAVRFADGAWHRLDAAAGWPTKLLQLVPLLDGQVLQVIAQDDGNVAIHLSQLDSIPLDAAVVQPLIDQLSDPDPSVRSSASAELSRYGPGLWPILDKALADQPPEGEARIHQLLADRDRPTLNEMSLQSGPAQIIGRCADGSAILHLVAGVTMPGWDADRTPVLIAPADLIFEPGQPVKLSNPFLTRDLPADAVIQRASGEWVISDAAEGSKRFMENHFEPLLRPNEQMYSQFIGIDRQGRWLFRRPMTMQPTLVLDPTLPDNRPLLAAWKDPIKADHVGWDQQHWPLFVRGKNISVLQEDGWSLNGDEKEAQAMMTQSADHPANEPASQPASRSTSEPTTQLGELLLQAEGSSYFGGFSELIVRRGGRNIQWELPPDAVGSGTAYLVKAGAELFLFNQPGRVIRLAEQDATNGPPFKIDAIFTRQIPNAALQRVWVDPAGRINLMSDDSHLTILFPDGRIPAAIAQMMPAEQVNAARSP